MHLINSKNAIFNAPVLAQFKSMKQILLSMDACIDGIGPLMEQDHENGRHLVAVIFRKLSQPEQNYEAHGLKLLEIVDSLRTRRGYLHGQKFIVHTNHRLLKYLKMHEFQTLT